MSYATKIMKQQEPCGISISAPVSLAAHNDLLAHMLR